MRIGKYIAKKRKTKGLSIRKAAKKAELSASWWSKLERGINEYPPEAESLRKIAAILELSHSNMMLLAGRIPDNYYNAILEGLKKNPKSLEDVILFFE